MLIHWSNFRSTLPIPTTPPGYNEITAQFASLANRWISLTDDERWLFEDSECPSVSKLRRRLIAQTGYIVNQVRTDCVGQRVACPTRLSPSSGMRMGGRASGRKPARQSVGQFFSRHRGRRLMIFGSVSASTAPPPGTVVSLRVSPAARRPLAFLTPSERPDAAFPA